MLGNVHLLEAERGNLLLTLSSILFSLVIGSVDSGVCFRGAQLQRPLVHAIAINQFFFVV